MNLLNRPVFFDASLRRWLHFHSPCKVLCTSLASDVVPLLQQVEADVKSGGRYAAGFISYEAAPAFDSCLRVRSHGLFPLAWFGLYSEPAVIDFPACPARSAAFLSRPRSGITRPSYLRSLQAIKDKIAAGETYQANFTFQNTYSFSGTAWDFFTALVHGQKASCCGFIETDTHCICSGSPELFFSIKDDRIVSRPMKGTVGRGLSSAQDAANARWLAQSEKNRAENVMIVDMVRNDIGRIAASGSVRATRLFDLEQYPTLWQMTSTVEATTTAPVCEILAALFPSASITGAPKPSTMAIIAQLETTTRLVYTGTMGFFTPQRRAQFNVAIRTLLIDKSTSTASYGVGGGITWPSDPAEEYRECGAKTAVLFARQPRFSLLETILWTRAGGFFLLDDHLNRLYESAHYFGFFVDIPAVRSQLVELVGAFLGPSMRVRLLLSEDGRVATEASPFHKGGRARPVRLRLADAPIDKSNVFLYHKTTLRNVYDAALATAGDADDVLLWNSHDEITETSIANVVLRLKGELVTPSLSAGLLPGVFRGLLLRRKRIRETSISIDDLKCADAIYTVNSVRQIRRATLIG
jgi:para-aminobenzoate synthetase/4-amino-4-deoxychorismate lyase